MTNVWIKIRITLIYIVIIILYRFIDADGHNYSPTRTITGPYGSTDIFTGPKVSI